MGIYLPYNGEGFVSRTETFREHSDDELNSAGGKPP
jgi:hypothetical protein